MRENNSSCRGGYYPPAADSLPGRRRCEASRRRFRRRRRSETKRSDLGWRFSFFSHSFFCKKKKEWEKEKTCPLRWISFHPKRRVRCAGPSIFLVLGKKDEGERTRTPAACERPLSGLFAPPPLPGVSPAALVGSKNPSIITGSQVLRSLRGADLGWGEAKPAGNTPVLSRA